MPKLYDATLYHIKTLTNLHVGNGETNYSVIDKQVQRDPLTNLPTINASSLKGATKEAMLYGGIKQDDPAGEGARSVLRTVFGSDPHESDQRGKQGYVNFFDAKLLSLPVRCDKVPYLRATSKRVLYDYIEYCEQFELAVPLTRDEVRTLAVGYSHDDIDGEIQIEDMEQRISSSSCLDQISSLVGGGCVLLDDEQFDAIAAELPFVARNYLENGKSENLWYEEIVPRESLFYAVLQRPTSVLMAHLARQESDMILDDGDNGLEQRKKNRKKDALVTAHLDAFDVAMNEIQIFIGANTTVGYGLCQINAVATTKPATTQEEHTTEGAPS